MEGTVEILTHSATVNHGGGLRKARERVWANPVHYAHQMAAAMSKGTPVRVQVACDTYSTSRSFGHIPAHRSIPVLDAMAVIDESGTQLVVLLLNRSAVNRPIDVSFHIGSLAAHPRRAWSASAG